MSAQPLYEISNPTGMWRCTRSTFRQFVVGETYPCLPDKSGTGYRIYPELEICAWSPYWVPKKGRFCYESKQLDFVFVGPIPATEKAEMISKRDTTLPKNNAHISFPLTFEEEARQAPSPRKKSKISGFIQKIGDLAHNHARDLTFFGLGVIATLLAIFSL